MVGEQTVAAVAGGAAQRRLTVRRVLRVLAQPSTVWAILNAQLRLRGAGRVPISTRLTGRARVAGGGHIVLGERLNIIGTAVPVELVAAHGARLAIGDGTFINYGSSIAAQASVSIGRDCAIGQYAIINDNDYHQIDDKQRMPPSDPVVIEDRVWLGARVTVLKGVRIGHDAVIGAGSVVTRDIPPRSIAVGVPARVVRRV